MKLQRLRHQLLIAERYQKPEIIRGIYTNPAWRQDNSRSLWQVLQSSPEADAQARAALQPGWIVITPKNSGVLLDHETVMREDGRPDTRERFLLHAGLILRIIPWTSKGEQVRTLGKRLLVAPDNVAEKSGPIILPAGTRMPVCTGTAVEVGVEVKDIAVGDRVVYSLYSGTHLEVNGAPRIIMDEVSVMAIAEKDEKVVAT